MINALKKTISPLLGQHNDGSKEAYEATAQLIGAAYEGRPTQEKALVFAYEGKEYLVPFSNLWIGNSVIESTVFLNRVERIVARPDSTSRISEMIRSKKISDQAKAAILKGVRAWFRSGPTYKVRLIPFAENDQ